MKCKQKKLRTSGQIEIINRMYIMHSTYIFFLIQSFSAQQQYNISHTSFVLHDSCCFHRLSNVKLVALCVYVKLPRTIIGSGAPNTNTSA